MDRKLLLVSPRRDDVSYDGFTDRLETVVGESGTMLVASLATVASLTPRGFSIRMVDESVETLDFTEGHDVVGITSFPSQLYRAEQIAREFSRRGSLIVCGGSSVSLTPEKWRSFADVLIIGEAERIWPEFIRDYLAGTHRAEYRERDRFDLSISPMPDYSGYAPESVKRHSMGIVQASRGCPFDCEFCDAIVYSGRKSRYKSPSQILQEVRNLERIGLGRHILLSDDNFAANRRKAKGILTALRAWNGNQKRPVSFHTQLTIDCAEDEEFLALAAEAGMGRVFVGLESPNLESLRETNKRPNLGVDMLARHIHEGLLISSPACSTAGAMMRRSPRADRPLSPVRVGS